MSSARESGDLAERLPAGGSRKAATERLQAATRRQAHQKSETSVVPEKSMNPWVTPGESMEERDVTNGNPPSETRSRAQDRERALTHLERIGKAAREGKEEKFNNLLSHIKVPLLKEALMRLKKRSAPGVDGISWRDYAEAKDLDARLLDLQDRIHRGSYHPRPSRRVRIAKGDGRERLLGVPALEDKLVQQAVRMLLEPIYEAAFLGFSYGFRPDRSQHKALDALFVALGGKTNWVLDADIASFFDTIDHRWMQKFLEHRIADRRLVRLLMKWMNAGVMEDGELHETEMGTPQGGVISPLLANIYLHYVLDLWVQQWRKREARGEVYIVRYADDVVMGFQHEEDARKMHSALAERLSDFGLELHPGKTRVLRFGRFARRDSALDGHERPETFDFLGFTHICGEGRAGKFRLIRRTSKKKRDRKLSELSGEIRKRRHHAMVDQHSWLNSVLRGHYNYYGVPGNIRALGSFRRRVRRSWHASLQRRSQRAGWSRKRLERIERLFPLPNPRITQQHPLERLPFR